MNIRQVGFGNSYAFKMKDPKQAEQLYSLMVKIKDSNENLKNNSALVQIGNGIGLLAPDHVAFTYLDSLTKQGVHSFDPMSARICSKFFDDKSTKIFDFSA